MAATGDGEATPAPVRGVATLWRLLPYIRPHRTQLSVGLLCVMLGSASGASVPWLLRAGLDELRAGAPLQRIWTIGAIMIGATIGTGLLRYTMRELLNGLSRLVEYDLRNDLFAKLTALDVGWFGRTRTGDIMARLTNDLSAVRMAAGPAIMYLANTIAGGVFAIAGMASISGRLMLLAIIPAAFIPLIALRLGKLVHDRFERVQEHFGTLTTQAQENISGTRVVRAYGQEASEIARFTALGEEYSRRNMAMARLNGIMSPSFALLAGLGSVDLVVPFEEDTPLKLIEAARPQVLVKGADYSESEVVGHELVKGWGGEVKLAPIVEGYSTTAAIAKMSKKASA